MIVFALLLHLVFLASVFDIYFKSPVVPSSRQFAPDYVAPARRLVLFVADGLRADSLYGLSEAQTPYFRKIIRDYGAWGVSHTRVPTESRPGHVALIAGMFEDPSAITRGWRENPVDFDTLFNQSRYTWSWGSPDILPMFSKGASLDENNSSRVFTEMYESSFEDFSSHDLSALDTWVFDKVEAFFDRAASDPDLQMKLRQDKLVLFLHLLGCDTNGHANKPHSKELLHNIKVLDERVKKLVDVIEKYWRKDGRTAYLFTSDHGMTDWGSHGAGLDHETQTPLIAWGAGIRQPKIVNNKPVLDQWPLVHGTARSDVNQTDVSTLMSALLGVNMPQNSMGKLPLDYLKLHQSHLAKAKLSNVMQGYEQFLAHQRQFANAPLASIFHSPFPDLTAETFENLHSKILRLESSNRYKEELDVLDIFYNKSVEGLYYYQRYHRFSLYAATTFSYIGFVIYIAIILTKNYSPLTVPVEMSGSKKRNIYVTSFLTICLTTAATFAQNAPWHYAVYYTCPVIVTQFVICEIATFQLLPVSKTNLKHLSLFLALCFLIIECLVLSFFDRRLLSVAIILVCVMQNWSCQGQERLLRAIWTFLCLVLCLFSFMPTVGKESNTNLVAVSGITSAISALALFRSFITPLRQSQSKISSVPIYMGIFYLVLSSICVWATNSQQHVGAVKSLSQTAGWFVMVTSLTVALLTEPLLLPRLLALSVALQSMYLLLSLSYEGLFLLCLVGLLLIWLVMEHRKCFAYQSWIAVPMTEVRERRVLMIDDIWRALLFLFFSIVSFFGTGNLASINSFDPKSIRTLVSVFNPFLMGGLLLLKVLIPFLVVACFVCAVRQVSQMPSRALFLLLLLFSDLMGLHFFFLVTDRGSWLDIGTSLSHFVIAEGTVIFLQLFYMLAKYLMQFKCLLGRTKMEDNQRKR